MAYRRRHSDWDVPPGSARDRPQPRQVPPHSPASVAMTAPLTRIALAGALAMAWGLAGAAEAAVTINTVARGSVADNVASSGGDNYLTGAEVITGSTGLGGFTFSRTEYRSFFSFDLTGQTGLGAVTNAVFSADTVDAATSAETLGLFDVVGDPDFFTDLGTGIGYGTASIAAGSTSTVVINFNAAGLSAINNALGGVFTFGGALTTLDMTPPDGTTADELVFGGTGASPASPGDGATFLDLTFASAGPGPSATVPEPGSLVLFGLTACGLFGGARRRRAVAAA